MRMLQCWSPHFRHSIVSVPAKSITWGRSVRRIVSEPAWNHDGEKAYCYFSRGCLPDRDFVHQLLEAVLAC